MEGDDVGMRFGYCIVGLEDCLGRVLVVASCIHVGGEVSSGIVGDNDDVEEDDMDGDEDIN